MSSGQLLIVLGVAAVTLFAVAVLRQAGVPAPVVLVVAGLIIGFLPFVPDVSLHPDVVLLGLLPLLVFDAAVTSRRRRFSATPARSGCLPCRLVVATAFGVAAVAHWFGHLSWPMAFVLGTAVGPTDASAATSIARRLGLPRRLITILEGEALFNDATALVLYAAAVAAATTGHFSVLHTAGSIVYSAVAGAAIGLAVGLAGPPAAQPDRRSADRDRRLDPAGLRRLSAGRGYPRVGRAGRRVRRPVSGLAQQRRRRSRRGAGCSRGLSGRPWCSWSTPPCSCWSACRSTPSARKPRARWAGWR